MAASPLRQNQEFLDDCRSDMTKASIVEKWECSSGLVVDVRKELGGPLDESRSRDGRVEQLGSYDFNVGTGEGEFKDIPSHRPLEAATDWTHIFEQFNLDPDSFEVVGDTIRCSTWQQSKRTEGGDRDIIQLYSYRAQFRRKSADGISTEAIDAFRKKVADWRLPARITAGPGEPVAIVLNMADFQLFKSEGGGVDATLERIYGGLARFIEKLEFLRQIHNIEEIVLVNNGDPFEGIAGNYASQTHTVQGGLRAQMSLVIEVWLAFARELFPRFKKAQFVSVLCNHTEFGRQGGAAKSITSDSDNGSAFLAEMLQRILEHSPGFEHVTFVIPHDEMNIYTEAAGVPMGFNHGHKIPGNDAGGFEKWLNGQVRGSEQAYRAKIWVTAHRHNFQTWDLGSAAVFSCPSCDGGSKWLYDSTGKFSRAGMISFIVDKSHPLGWSDVAFH